MLKACPPTLLFVVLILGSTSIKAQELSLNDVLPWYFVFEVSEAYADGQQIHVRLDENRAIFVDGALSNYDDLKKKIKKFITPAKKEVSKETAIKRTIVYEVPVAKTDSPDDETLAKSSALHAQALAGIIDAYIKARDLFSYPMFRTAYDRLTDRQQGEILSIMPLRIVPVFYTVD